MEQEGVMFGKLRKSKRVVHFFVRSNAGKNSIVSVPEGDIDRISPNSGVVIPEWSVSVLPDILYRLDVLSDRLDALSTRVMGVEAGYPQLVTRLECGVRREVEEPASDKNGFVPFRDRPKEDP